MYVQDSVVGERDRIVGKVGKIKGFQRRDDFVF